jgi:hypothetical protein
VSLVLWWPQALVVWRCRRDPDRLRGVSVTSQVLLLLNAVLWGVYAVAAQSLWVGAPGLVNAPLAVVTIVVLRRSASARREAPRAAAPASTTPAVAPVGAVRRVAAAR